MHGHFLLVYRRHNLKTLLLWSGGIVSVIFAANIANNSLARGLAHIYCQPQVVRVNHNPTGIIITVTTVV